MSSLCESSVNIRVRDRTSDLQTRPFSFPPLAASSESVSPSSTRFSRGLHSSELLPVRPASLFVFSLDLVELIPSSPSFIAVVLLMPIQTWLTSLNFSLHNKYRKASDERTNLLTELINSIKIIKFFAWEQRWLDKIDDARAKELKFKVQGELSFPSHPRQKRS